MASNKLMTELAAPSPFLSADADRDVLDTLLRAASPPRKAEAQRRNEQGEVKQVFDVQAFLRDTLGLEVRGAGSAPGKVRVQAPVQEVAPPQGGSPFATGDEFGDNFQEPQEAELDVASLLKNEMGVDPAKLQLQLNKPEDPVPDSPMGFVDRVKFEAAQTPKDKLAYLVREYGRENVKVNPETGQMVVQKDGAWFDANETGAAGLLGGQGDVVAGAVGGATAATSALGPAAATVPGALAVAGAAGWGAVVARLGTYQAARAAGLRSEQDYDELGKELGKEFIVAASGEIAGQALLKGVPAAARAVNRSMKKLSAMTLSPAAKETLASTMSMMTNVDKVDNLSWLEMPDEVAGHQARAIAYEQAPGRIRNTEANPLRKEMGDMVQDVVLKSKDHMHEAYVTGMKGLEGVTSRTRVNIDPVLSRMQNQFESLGLVDSSGNWLPEGHRNLAKVVDKSSVNRLRQTYEILRRARRAGTKVEGKAARESEQFAAALVGDESKTIRSKESVLSFEPTSTSPSDGTQLDMFQPNPQQPRANQQLTATVNEVERTTITPDTRALVYNQPKRVLTEQGELLRGPDAGTYVSFNEARTLVRNLDEILEAAGQYNMGAAQVTTPAKAEIVRLRADMHDNIVSALRSNSDLAADRWQSINETFSQRRDWLDDMAIQTKDNRLDNTLKKLVNPETGSRDREALISLLKGTGINADVFMNELFARRAGLNTAELYRLSSSGQSVVQDTLSTATGWLGLTSPRRSTRSIAQRFGDTKRKALIVEYMKGLPKQQRETLFQNPTLLSAISQMVAQGQALEEQVPAAVIPPEFQQGE